MNLDSLEFFVQDQLARMGFSVEKIKESRDKKTPDFFAEKLGYSYLIEVKSKNDSDSDIVEQKNNFNANKPHTVSKSIQRNNRISGIIADACRQLRAKPDSDKHIKLVWLQASGLHEDIQFDEFLFSLYGIANLLSFNSINDKSPVFKDCYFFSNSDFFNHKDCLDGAILGTSKGGLLCLNPYSKGYQYLASSPLIESMSPNIIDPSQMEEDGHIYLVNSSVDRREESLVLKELQNKYGLKYVSIARTSAFSGLIEIPVSSINS